MYGNSIIKNDIYLRKSDQQTIVPLNSILKLVRVLLNALNRNLLFEILVYITCYLSSSLIVPELKCRLSSLTINASLEQTSSLNANRLSVRSFFIAKLLILNLSVIPDRVSNVTNDFEDASS